MKRHQERDAIANPYDRILFGAAHAEELRRERIESGESTGARILDRHYADVRQIEAAEAATKPAPKLTLVDQANDQRRKRLVELREEQARLEAELADRPVAKEQPPTPPEAA